MLLTILFDSERNTNYSAIRESYATLSPIFFHLQIVGKVSKNKFIHIPTTKLVYITEGDELLNGGVSERCF